jgi:hypothetical protein
MSRSRDIGGPPRRGASGPIEPGSILYRILLMVAEEIARSQARAFPESTESFETARPLRIDRNGEGTFSPVIPTENGEGTISPIIPTER